MTPQVARPGHAAVRLGRAAAVGAALVLAGAFATATPAAADTNTYADAVGEDTTAPGFDITSYRVQLTETALTITVRVNGTPANPLPDAADVVAQIDTDGDEMVDFRAERGFDGRWWVSAEGAQTESCIVPGSADVASATVVIPTSCLGEPDAVAVVVGVYTAWDHGPWDVSPTGELHWFPVPVGAGPEDGPSDAPQLDVFRFWSPRFSNAHFFTTDEAEAWHLVQSDPNWEYEGIAFGAVVARDATCDEGAPVFRFWSARFQSHFYTQNAGEKAAIVAHDRNWTYEKVAYCAYSTQIPGSIPLYRFWSPGFGKHFFTADQGEADHIRSVDRNWTYEGVAYYVLP